MLIPQLTSLYAALLGLLFIPFTLRVARYRYQHRISLGDGDDRKLMKLIRAQGNFVETVPLALILMLLMEMSGASSVWLHSLGIALVLGRLSHYLQVSGMLKPLLFRMLGMVATIAVYLAASLWLLFCIY